MAAGEAREERITGWIAEGRRPTVSEMEDEQRAGVRMMQGRQEMFHRLKYIVGVDACLLRLRARGDDLPW